MWVESFLHKYVTHAYTRLFQALNDLSLLSSFENLILPRLPHRLLEAERAVVRDSTRQRLAVVREHERAQ